MRAADEVHCANADCKTDRAGPCVPEKKALRASGLPAPLRRIIELHHGSFHFLFHCYMSPIYPHVTPLYNVTSTRSYPEISRPWPKQSQKPMCPTATLKVYLQLLEKFPSAGSPNGLLKGFAIRHGMLLASVGALTRGRKRL